MVTALAAQIRAAYSLFIASNPIFVAAQLDLGISDVRISYTKIGMLAETTSSRRGERLARLSHPERGAGHGDAGKKR
ncbi:hypothetical protein ACNKHO_13375 [Shigella flexneri]